MSMKITNIVQDYSDIQYSSLECIYSSYVLYVWSKYIYNHKFKGRFFGLEQLGCLDSLWIISPSFLALKRMDLLLMHWTTTSRLEFWLYAPM